MRAPAQLAPPLEPTAALWRERALTMGFALWGVGVLSVEALASAGLVICCAVALLSIQYRRETPVHPEPLGSARDRLRRGARAWLWSWAPLLAFVAWALLGPWLGGGRPPSGTGVARWADWLAIPLAASVWPALGPAARSRLAWILGATFALSCVVAGCQHFGVWPRPELFEPLAWTKFPFHRVYEPVPGAPGRFMAGGLLAHRLKFAHTGGLVVLAALIFGLRSTGRVRAAALGLAAVGTISVLVFPYARAAAAALLACLPVALALSLRQRRKALAVGGLVLLAGVGVIALRPSVRERFLTSASAQGSGDRAFLLEAGANAVRAAPFTGVGAGRFRIREWAGPGAPAYVLENTGKAHNQLLSVAAEAGLPGLLLFVLALAALALRLRPVTPVRAVGLVALLHFLLLSLTHDPLYQAPYSMALALALSFAASEGQRPGGSA